MRTKRKFTAVLRHSKDVGPRFIEAFAQSQGIPPDDVGLIVADPASHFGKFLFEMVAGEETANKYQELGRPFLIPLQLNNLIDITRKFFPRLVRQIDRKRNRYQVILGLNGLGGSAVFTIPLVTAGDSGVPRVARQAAHAGPGLIAVYARAEGIEPKDVALVAADERSLFGIMVMGLVLGNEKATKYIHRPDARPFVVPIRANELVDLGRDVFPYLLVEILGRPQGFHAVLLVDAEDTAVLSTLPLVDLAYKRPLH